MPYSMTAFARIEVKKSWGIAIWEMRSVNQRFLETFFRLPERFRTLEPNLRDILRQQLTRGKVECSLRVELTTPTMAELSLNHALATQVIQSLQWLKHTAGEGEIHLMDVLRYPNVVETPEQNLDEVIQDLQDGFHALLAEFLAMRWREGQKLQALIEGRLQEMEQEVKQVITQMPEVLHWQRERLLSKFQELNLALDPLRLEQEMVLTAQKLDVAEELDRLQLHIKETQRILQNDKACGRKLDFMMQELNRETNTLASKSINANITRRAVAMKVLIEQMREQIQNME